MVANPVANIPAPKRIPPRNTNFLGPTESTLGPKIIIPTGTIAKEILKAKEVWA